MRYLIEFTGEHPSLPLEELKGASYATGEEFTLIGLREKLAIVETEKLINTIARAALVRNFSLECTNSYYKTPGSIELEQKGECIRAFISNHFPRSRSYRISLRKLGGRHPRIDTENVIKGLARGIEKDRTGDIELEVSLHSPDIEMIIYITPVVHFDTEVTSDLYFGIKLIENDRKEFRKREVRYRPYFSPISLHPVFARAVVNMSRVRDDEILLDPFCGTGGIILEASKIGLKPIGSDLDEEMLEGARINLNHFDQDAIFIHSDIGCIIRSLEEHGFHQVDGIATDMPYARASTTFGEDLSSLTERAFLAFEEALKPGGYASVVSSDPDAVRANWGQMELISCHRLKVHRSLMRYFMVYRKER